MRVARVSNVPVSDSPVPGQSLTPFGGWVEASFLELAKSSELEFLVAAPGGQPRSLLEAGEKALHSSIPIRGQLEYFGRVFDDWRPDVVHVHGTEYPHSLAAVTAAAIAGIPSVVSIQGFMASYADAFYYGIPQWVRYGFTPRDFVRRRNTWAHRREFKKRAAVERLVIERTRVAIGRTAWDRDCVASINPRTPYLENHETLRPAFYGKQWSLDTAQQYSIFLAQGSYPIKGAHVAISAMPIILRSYPSAILRIAGHDPTHSGSKFQFFRRTSYGAYLSRLIRELGVERHVRFVGLLREEEMASELLRSHVYLNASAAENSPNSLGEAMLLGLPCTLADVGGIPTMADLSSSKFFPAGDYRSLAARVIEVFSDPAAAAQMGERARQRAIVTHDPQQNASDLLGIYRGVVL